MGGTGRIYYSSISRYASDLGMTGQAFQTFVTLIRAMDDEYLAFVEERQKEQAEKTRNAKNKGGGE